MNYITYILFIFIIIFAYKNIILIKELSASKEYKKIYSAILDRDDDAKNKLEEYIKKETNEHLLSKANVLLMYLCLQYGKISNTTIDQIDYEKIFLKKGKYDVQYVNINSDMFIWTLCCLPLLKKVGYLPLIKEKISKLQDRLSNHVEYKVFNSAVALLEGNENDSRFLDELVNGEYSGLVYDKQLIGVTKRVSLAYIASKNKEKNIEYADELKILSNTMLGSGLLKDLEIYEVYK